MPYKTNKRFTSKKRPWRKKPSRAVVINRPVVPDTTIVKMRYHSTVSINPITGLAGNHLFRCGSIFDPDYTSTGHQPYGHDEWTQFYNHYCVIGSKCTAKFVTLGTVGAEHTAICGVGLQRDTSLVSTPDLIVERRDASYKILTNMNANQTATVMKCFSPKKFHGYKDMGDSAETRTAVGANPSDDAYFNVFVSPLLGSHDVSPVLVSVTIDYIVKLMERKDLSQS